MQRAAIHFQNTLGNQANILPPSTLFSDIADTVNKQKEEVRKKKIEEETKKQNELSLLKTEQEALTQGKKIEKTQDSTGKRTIKISDDAELSLPEQRKIQREERLTKQMNLNNASKLRNELQKLPEVADFVTVNTNVNSMDALLQEALTKKDKQSYLAIDQGLITLFNKLTDPSSVVRESEYARTPQNLPMVNSILGALNKVQSGGAGMTDEDRKALVQGAKIILQERAEPYNSRLKEYETLAIQYDIDPTMVIRGLEPLASQGQNDSGQYKIGQIIVHEGKRYKVVGGDMNDPDLEEVQ